MPRAASLAAQIKLRFGVDPRLEVGKGGVFDVRVGAEVIFSRHAQGRFPTPDEILDLIAARPP